MTITTERPVPETIESYADLSPVRRSADGHVHVCSLRCPGLCGADWRAYAGMPIPPSRDDWKRPAQTKAAS